MKNFVCISTNFWNAKWERMQQISMSLSNHGKVLYLEPISSIKNIRRFLKYFLALFWPRSYIFKKKNNLFTYPLIALLPFGSINFINCINRFFIIRTVKKNMETLKISNCILIIWDFWEANKFIGNIEESLVVLDYFDNYVAYHNYSEKKKKRVQTILYESIRKSDIVFASSTKLLEDARGHNQNIYLAPNGVDLPNYFKKKNISYDDISSIPKPIVGYMGGNNFENTAEKLDYELLFYLTEQLKEASFVFIGPIDEIRRKNSKLDRLRERKNVYFLGRKKPEQLPDYLEHFDVCIIPWLINEFTEYVYPLKINEYLACGKPVVSTPLPDLLRFNQNVSNLISIAGNYELFVSQTKLAIEQNSEQLEKKRVDIAKQNSWDQRVNQMVKIIDNKLNIKPVKKIIQVFNSRINKHGSFEDFMIELAKKTKNNNINISFVFPDMKTPKVKNLIEAYGSDIYVIKENWKSFYLIKNILKICLKEKPQIFNFHFCSSLNFALLFIILRLMGIKIVYHYHGEIIPINELKFANRHFSKLRLLSLFVNKIICVSEANKRFLKALNIRKKVIVIYNGINVRNFKKQQIYRDFKKEMSFTNGELIVTSIASLIPRKGIDILIKAAKEVIEEIPNTRFILVGGGDKGPYQKLAEELGISDKIVFMGLLKEYPYHILKATDLYVSASFAESFGLSTAEAQLLGIPAVATKVGGVPEVVNNGKSGILVPAGDSKRLALEIIRLLKNKDLRRDLGNFSKQWIADRFNLENTVEELINVCAN